MSYEKLRPGDAAYAYVERRKKLGAWACDARDHNESAEKDIPCPNEECRKNRASWDAVLMVSRKHFYEG